MKNTLSRHTISILLFTATASFFEASQAMTLCEDGRVSYFEILEGGDSIIQVSSEPFLRNTEHLKQYTDDGKYATRIWYRQEPIRWEDKLSLLKIAYALQLPVKIQSYDDNCRGNIDEFRIIFRD